MDKKKIGGLALAAAIMTAPVASEAAVVFINDAITDSVATNVSITDQTATYIYDQTLSGVTAGQQAIFDFTNNTSTNITLGAGFPATVNPTGSFPSGTLSWAGGTSSVLEGGAVNHVLTPGSSGTLTISFGQQVGQFANVDVIVSQVPLPAGGLLLLTALGGIGIARRSRKAA